MKNNSNKKSWFYNAGRSLAGGLLVALMALAVSGVANAQEKKDVITFNLAANPDTVGCLRANSYEEPRAHATVIRGKSNDTLILDLDGIKPGLAFDLFTIQRSPLLADGSKDAAFTNVFNGSFGLAWYQSDLKITQGDNGHVRIQTILLDDIFGFDPDVRLLRQTRSMSASGSTILMPRRIAVLIRRNQSRSTAITSPARWP